jgi:hypothetical protein
MSIGGPFQTWTSTGFPYAGFPTVAPFWGDVDTRDSLSGLVYYKLSPTYLIIQWEQVGYFSNHSDLLNTFQLIITDGNDTILPLGNNVNFCYQDMQWTTGDASGGVGGFGGTPTTVGINQGNGVDYIQLGLYDHAGVDWDGPAGINDGISSLDGQSFYFNCCFSNSNIPPVIRSTAVCDTLHLCVGDTFLVDADYLSPEPAQITTPSVNTNGMAGITILQQITANIAHIQLQIIANAANLGYNTVFLIGTDNGFPSQTSITPIVIGIHPSTVASTISITYLNCSCQVMSTASGGTAPYTYQWCDGSTNPVMNNCTPETCILTITDSFGCIVTDTAIITPPPALTMNPVVTNASCSGCYDGSILINPSGGLMPYQVYLNGVPVANDTIPNLQPGTYVVCMTDAWGCSVCDTLQISNPTEISSLQNSKPLFIVGPVPAKGKLSIAGPKLSEMVSIELYDQIGERVLSQNIHKSSDGLHDEVNVSGLSQGIFNYVIRTEKQILQSGRVVINR